jgi:hypothetical protein
MASKGPAKKRKDLSPKSSNAVKGGRTDKLAVNDNWTLVRAAKPTPKKKDLPSRKDVKGGNTRLSANDNITLVRAPR